MDGCSLVSDILKDLGFDVKGEAGGPLTTMDIKDISLDQMIKLSLLDEACYTGVLREMRATSLGEIEFRIPGTYNGMLDCEVYYQIQVSTFKEKASGGVMATSPFLKPTVVTGDFSYIVNAGKGAYNSQSFTSTNEVTDQLSNYSTIFFDDPRVGTLESDRIGLNDPYFNKSLVGYVRKLNWNDSSAATVKLANSTAIAIKVSDGVGSLSSSGEPGSAISVAIPSDLSDRFGGVDSILIVGKRVDSMRGVPASGDNSCDILLCMPAGKESVYKLKAGEHYITNYSGGSLSVSFINNARPNDPATFGDGSTAKVDKICSDEGATSSITGSFLPTGGTDGYIVSQVIAIVIINKPCINVYSPSGDASSIAGSVKYEESPIVIKRAGTKTAIDGESYEFTSKTYDTIVESMKGVGVTLDNIIKTDAAHLPMLTGAVYRHFSHGEGTITTYVCGPDSHPIIGGHGLDSTGIVNDVVYSYSDSSAYTISVSTGGYQGNNSSSLPDSSDTMSPARTTYTDSGVVTDDYGDYVNYKVETETLGFIEAINIIPEEIVEGDIVQCTIHMG